MSLMNEIKTLLQPETWSDALELIWGDVVGLAWVSGQNEVFIGSQPLKPDNCITVYPTGGYDRSLTGTFVEEPTFQVRIRNTNYVAGEAVADQIKDLLHGNSTEKVLMIQQQGDLNPLGKDTSNRVEFSLNFRCYLRR